MTQTINELMDRLKNLREFTITVDVPDGITLSGVIPFDMNISKNKGTFRVLAVSEEEAKERVNAFLNK